MLINPRLINFCHIINGLLEDLDLLLITKLLCGEEGVLLEVWGVLSEGKKLWRRVD